MTMTGAATRRTFTTSDHLPISFTLHPSPREGAPRIALIHSLALDRSVWDGVVERLHGDAEILTYDCRGHGQSGRRADAYTADLFGRDLAELLDHVGWPQTAVAGCSMGGNVAQAFAGLYPQRATALGLIDTTAWYGADAPAKFAERAAAAAAKGMRGLIDFQLTRWFSDEFRASHPDELARLTTLFAGNDLDCYAASCGLLGSVDTRPYLPTFHMPVAVVVGEEDYATPVAMAEHLHRSIPQSTFTILPRARHLTPIEHPDAIASELLSVLRR
jgi:3-oxoadipate enol-lactonase